MARKLVHSIGDSFTAGDIEPAEPHALDLWWDTSKDVLYFNGVQWVPEGSGLYRLIDQIFPPYVVNLEGYIRQSAVRLEPDVGEVVFRGVTAQAHRLEHYQDNSIAIPPYLEVDENDLTWERVVNICLNESEPSDTGEQSFETKYLFPGDEIIFRPPSPQLGVIKYKILSVERRLVSTQAGIQGFFADMAVRFVECTRMEPNGDTEDPPVSKEACRVEMMLRTPQITWGELQNVLEDNYLHVKGGLVDSKMEGPLRFQTKRQKA